MAVPQTIDVPFRMYKGGTSPNVVQGPSATIDRSIRTIIRTVPGERPYRPTFGCWARAMVFANMTEGAALQTAAEIRRAVAAWEPRADIQDILFELSGTTVALTVIWRANGAPTDSTTTIGFVT